MFVLGVLHGSSYLSTMQHMHRSLPVLHMSCIGCTGGVDPQTVLASIVMLFRVFPAMAVSAFMWLLKVSFLSRYIPSHLISVPVVIVEIVPSCSWRHIAGEVSCLCLK